MDESTISIITKAREYVANPKTWTKGVPARNCKGGEVDYFDKSAARFCAQGAICKAALDLYGTEYFFYLKKTFDFIKGKSLPLVNDGTNGRKLILALFDDWLHNLTSAPPTPEAQSVRTTHLRVHIDRPIQKPTHDQIAHHPADRIPSSNRATLWT